MEGPGERTRPGPAALCGSQGADSAQAPASSDPGAKRRKRKLPQTKHVAEYCSTATLTKAERKIKTFKQVTQGSRPPRQAGPALCEHAPPRQRSRADIPVGQRHSSPSRPTCSSRQQCVRQAAGKTCPEASEKLLPLPRSPRPRDSSGWLQERVEQHVVNLAPSLAFN